MQSARCVTENLPRITYYENSATANSNNRTNCILNNQWFVFDHQPQRSILSYLTRYCDYTYNNQKIEAKLSMKPINFRVMI